MLNRKIGCLALVIILLLLGALLFRPPDLPTEAAQALDRMISTQAGPDTRYRITSAEKATRTLAANAEYVAYYPGGTHLPAGIYPPDGASVQDSWCVILDQPVKLPQTSGSHILLQKQTGTWVAAIVADSEKRVFPAFGCSRW